MLSVIRRAPAYLTVALFLIIVGARTARADGGVICWPDPTTGQEICQVESGGGDDPPGSKGGDKSKRTPTCTAKAAYPPNTSVECVSGHGIWDQGLQCYLQLADPQPFPTGPNGEKKGSYYNCYMFPDFAKHYEWLVTAPRVPVDPEAVARDIVKRMALHRIDIGLAPRPGPNSLGLVGAPVYMWVGNPTPQTVGPLTRSATSYGVTVSATAKVLSFGWSMGDGHSVTCRGLGTPYQDSFGFRPSPTCGHTYTTTSEGRPASAYTVSATSYWRVDWVGNGETGWFEFSFTSSTGLRIGEAQVLVTKPNQ